MCGWRDEKAPSFEIRARKRSGGAGRDDYVRADEVAGDGRDSVGRDFVVIYARRHATAHMDLIGPWLYPFVSSCMKTMDADVWYRFHHIPTLVPSIAQYTKPEETACMSTATGRYSMVDVWKFVCLSPIYSYSSNSKWSTRPSQSR